MNKDYIFTQETQIAQPLPKVFDFFSKAENLEKLTPPRLKFEILSPLPVEMQRGTRIDYRIRLLGIPFKWKTEITIWEPPFRFQDVQLKGPYQKWLHTHTFEEKNGGIRMTDQVIYRPPFGLLGRLSNLVFIRKQIAAIFEYRRQQLDRLFGESL